MASLLKKMHPTQSNTVTQMLRQQLCEAKLRLVGACGALLCYKLEGVLWYRDFYKSNMKIA